MGDYAKAEPLFVEAVKIFKEMLGENHTGYAASLNNLASLHQEMGDYAKAEPLFVEAAKIFKEVLGENHPSYATNLHNLAGLYYETGDYAKAEPLFVEATEIRREVHGENHPDYAASLERLALLYHAMGDYAKAEPFFVEAIEIRKEVLGENHHDYAISLNNLAFLYDAMADYAQAEPLLIKAMEIYKEAHGESHHGYATSLDNLAALHQKMGDYAKAEPLSIRAMEVYKQLHGENHPDYAISLGNLASLYRAIGDYAKAKSLYIRSMGIKEQVLGENHPSYATSLDRLAGLYRAMGGYDYAKAEPLSIRAMEIRKEVLGEDHPDYAISLNNLAGLYHAKGDYAKAEPLLIEALRISRKLLERTASVQSERQQLAMGEAFRNQLDNYLSLALAKGGMAQHAFEHLLRWKGASFIRQRLYRQLAQEPAVAPLFEELQRVTRLYVTLSASQDIEPARLQQVETELERLEADIGRQSVAFRQTRGEIALHAVAKALPANSVLVDFLEFNRWTVQPGGTRTSQRSLLASVLHPDSAVNLVDLGPQQAVAPLLDIWRRSLSCHPLLSQCRSLTPAAELTDDTNPTGPEAQQAAMQLRRLLWEPLLPAIGQTRTVLISPDGVLGNLPWAALPGAQSQTYLLDTWQLVLLPVPQLLSALAANNGHQQDKIGLLLIGDVDYNVVTDDAIAAVPASTENCRSATGPEPKGPE